MISVLDDAGECVAPKRPRIQIRECFASPGRRSEGGLESELLAAHLLSFRWKGQSCGSSPIGGRRSSPCGAELPCGGPAGTGCGSCRPW